MKRPGSEDAPICTAKGLKLRPPGVWEAVDRGEVGLDVDERRAVDAVDPAYAERGCIDAKQLHGGERDGVGPHRRTQGKGAPGVAQVRRHLLYEIAPCSVHPIKQPDVAIEGEVCEPRRIARIKLDPAYGVGLRRALRAVAARFERRADAADEIDPSIVGVGPLKRHLARAQVAISAHQPALGLRSSPRPEPGWAELCRVCGPWSNGVSRPPTHP